ncbi:hypothetical protein L2E82_02058 [Cichorium intybus]|uniref:Uncharacterized protein n=1 Tax=Cichorium intybus TaxID=13427 RepID=A0ACB9H1W4_CICIN|nr:hypothetical protein L2E82_02058 [Cichorium intybus]
MLPVSSGRGDVLASCHTFPSHQVLFSFSSSSRLTWGSHIGDGFCGTKRFIIERRGILTDRGHGPPDLMGSSIEDRNWAILAAN